MNCFLYIFLFYNKWWLTIELFMYMFLFYDKWWLFIELHLYMFFFYNKLSLEMGSSELPNVHIATLYVVSIFFSYQMYKKLLSICWAFLLEQTKVRVWYLFTLIYIVPFFIYLKKGLWRKKGLRQSMLVVYPMSL